MLAIVRDLLAAAGGAAAAALWTGVFVRLVRARRMSSAASRKAVHVTTGPLFFLTLPLYSSRPSARVLAAVVPAAFSIRLLLAARGITIDGLATVVARGSDFDRADGNSSVRRCRRRRRPQADTADGQVGVRDTNDECEEENEEEDDEAEAIATAKAKADAWRREAAGGPFWYAVAVSAVTLVGWRTSRASTVAVGMLAFGDGCAELGSWLPLVRWPLPKGWKRKSVGGSLAFIVAGAVGSFGLTYIFGAVGLLAQPAISLPAAVRIATSCALVEILPYEDNVFVPVAAYLLTEPLA